MSSAQKVPFSRSMSQFATKQALDEIGKRGLALPGHVVAVDGALITVSFDVSDATLPQVTMPLFGPEYIRYPIQPGDQGVAFPASAYLGQVSGQGPAGQAATLTQRGNLSTLVWFPIANKNWTTPPGGASDTLTLYGKNELLLLDSIAGNSILKLNSTGITLTVGSHSIAITSSGITIGPNTTIDSRVFLNHMHTAGTYVAGSTPVTDDSGQVV